MPVRTLGRPPSVAIEPPTPQLSSRPNSGDSATRGDSATHGGDGGRESQTESQVTRPREKPAEKRPDGDGAGKGRVAILLLRFFFGANSKLEG